MEKKQSRRSFIRNAGILAVLSQIPLTGWAEGFSALFNEGINPSGEFSLLKLDKLLQDYQLPVADNFSEHAFSLHYRLFNLYGNNATPAGEMKWLMSAAGDRLKFRFMIDRRAGNGIIDRSQVFTYTVDGDVTCKNDDTLTPEEWIVSKRIALNGDGKGYLGTLQKSMGTVKNNRITSTEGKTKKVRNLTGSPLSWKWGIMAVVQNMARKNKTELQFSALDEFDAFYERQAVKFVKQFQLDCSGKIRTFSVFLHTGDGIIPTVYWVDDLCRTVFAITGMEAFALFSDK